MRCSRCGMVNATGVNICVGCGAHLVRLPDPPVSGERSASLSNRSSIALSAVRADSPKPSIRESAPTGSPRSILTGVLLPLAAVFVTCSALFFVAAVVTVSSDWFISRGATGTYVVAEAPSANTSMPTRVLASAPALVPSSTELVANPLPIPVSGGSGATYVSNLGFDDIDRTYVNLTGLQRSEYLPTLAGVLVHWNATITEVYSDGTVWLSIPGNSPHMISMVGIPKEVGRTLRRDQPVEFNAVITRAEDGAVGLYIELRFVSITL